MSGETAAAASSSGGQGGPGGSPHSAEVVSGFQRLRAEQRQLANKLSELELEMAEQRVVADTLRGVAGDRRCFRLVGGVLLERRADEVLTELAETQERLPGALQALRDQLAAKGAAINRYAVDHGIRVGAAQ